MRLIVITPEAMRPGEPAVARQMLQRGLQTLHLRKPGATREQLRRYLQELGDGWTECVMLHSHHDLSGEFRLKASGTAAADEAGGVVRRACSRLHADPATSSCAMQPRPSSRRHGAL
jgi:thiamine-phosphate pyrophosphorylase